LRPKFKNSSDPRQRLEAAVYAFRRLYRESSKRSADALDNPAKNRNVLKVGLLFAKAEKKAFARFGLDARRKTDREMLLAILSWILFGNSASRGRPRSHDQILFEIQQRIAPAIMKDPKISNAALARLLRRSPTENRKAGTLEKLAREARTRKEK